MKDAVEKYEKGGDLYIEQAGVDPPTEPNEVTSVSLNSKIYNSYVEIFA